MKVNYTGSQNGLTPALHRKLEARFGKLGKILDRREEKEAHVVIGAERHLFRAEVTVNYYDHPLVGIESSPDLFTALTSAIDKIEKQVLKLRAKFREKRRGGRAAGAAPPEPELAPAAPEDESGPRVFRANHSAARKPMTVEEALLEMEDDRDYFVYRDATTDRTAVLVRRRDGNFDLVEA
jgi:putative sigma-54 modulation protein